VTACGASHQHAAVGAAHPHPAKPDPPIPYYNPESGLTQPEPPSPAKLPENVVYPGRRSVLGYRFVRPPLVAIEDETPHVAVDVYYRLNNKPLSDSGSGLVIGPYVDGIGAVGWKDLGGGCYEAPDAYLQYAVPIRVGAIVTVTLPIVANEPALQARVPMLAIPPKILSNGSVDEEEPYLRLLGCRT
jgi:hypothetical protein